MCGRFMLSKSTPDMISRFGITEVIADLAPRYNIAPSQPIWVVREERVRIMEPMQWGLVPFWSREPGSGVINARMESLTEKPTFKQAFRRKRCLIPADGFYEWLSNNGVKRPFLFRLKERELFAFAGLWDEWTSPDGSPLRSCAIITVPSNTLLAKIHHRMPAILSLEDENRWLDTSANPVISDLLSLLAPYPPERMEMIPVSNKVNNPRYENPECMERAE
jgi:putative SOS response-associated peptidase YedK